jgi:hypothetical protein
MAKKNISISVSTPSGAAQNNLRLASFAIVPGGSIQLQFVRTGAQAIPAAPSPERAAPAAGESGEARAMRMGHAWLEDRFKRWARPA